MSQGGNQTGQPELISGFLREYQIIGNRRSSVSTPLVPIDHSTLWRWVREGRFPKPVKLGPHTTAWPAQAIRDWINIKGEGAA